MKNEYFEKCIARFVQTIFMDFSFEYLFPFFLSEGGM